MAQTATTPAGGTLGDVTVQADKPGSFGASTVQVGSFRDQNPLDVPVTNNVITREVLDAQGQRSLYGALRNTAGVTRSQLGGSLYDNIAIRGITVENRSSYRLNGSLPIVNQTDIPLENKERVEVLKGASSMYYGFVPPSGIVNFVTKRAGAQPVSSVATSINQYGAADVHLDLGRRFGADDGMGLRINAVAGREDLGIQNFRGDRQLLSAAFDMKLTSAAGIKLDLEHYRKDVSEQAAIQLLPNATTLPRVPDNKTNLAGDWARTATETTNLLARADVALNDNWSGLVEVGNARTTRDRRYSQFNLSNYATGAGTLAISYNDGQVYENTNVRLEVAGRLATGPLSHDLTFGYNRNDREQDTRATNPVSASFAGQNLYNPVSVPFIAQPRPSTTTTSKIVDKGVYAFDRVSFGEQWQLLAGVRQTDYRSVNLSPAGVPYTADKPSPNLALLYKATAALSLYTSYIRGLEAGSLVPVGAPANYANSGQLLPAATNKQWEIGAKAEVAQGVLLQAAYFDIRRAITTVSTGNNLTLDGEARYKGLEFAASGEISRNFALVASAMALDPKIVKDTVAAHNGNVPGNTAKATYSLFGEYRPDAVQGLALNAGWYYTGKRPVNNDNRVDIPGVGTLSLGVRFKTQLFGTRATLQANIDNATDKSYFSAADTTGTLVSTGLPRTVRLAAKFDF